MRARLGLAVLAGAAGLGGGIGLTAVAAWLIARAAAQPPVLELMIAIVAVRALALSKGVFRYLERLVAHDLAFRVLAQVRLRVYRQLARFAPADLGVFRRGELLTRLADDVEAAQDRIVRIVVPTAAATLAGLLAALVVTALLPAAGIVLAAGLLTAGIVVPWLSTALTGWADRRLVAGRGDLASHVVESLDAAEELTVLGAMPSRLADTTTVARRLAGAERRLAWVHGLAAALGMLTLALTVCAVLLVSIPRVSDGWLDPPVLAVLALLPIAAFDALGGIMTAARDRERVAAALGRLDDVFAARPSLAEPVTPSTAQLGDAGIVVRRLAARWPGAEEDVLHEIDLDLPPGKRIAVVGPSGAGKSTLLAVLLRFCPYAGDVTIGGVPLDAVPEEVLRRTIGLAAADAHVFDSTVAANLRLARPDATDDEIRTALTRAGLRGWVDSLPLGLDTPVGEHGKKLSGGQRQRLALARALLADVPVLLCDEPDVHLDPELADQVVADLLSAAEGRSVVIVTHRLVDPAAVDEIVVLEHGRIARRIAAPASRVFEVQYA